MLLKVNGCELEIVEDKFVCYATNDGDTNHFCEWNFLDPKLQERFKAMRRGLLEVMQEFALSDTMTRFQAVAEEYNADSNEQLPMICLEKPLNNTLRARRACKYFYICSLLFIHRDILPKKALQQFFR